MRIVLLLCSVVVFAAGCSGQLFLFDSGDTAKCTTSAECGFGRACEQGVCVDAPWCQCAVGQGCDNGNCVDIVTTGPGANSCSPERISGLCPDNTACCHLGTVCCAAGEVCVGDSCVPNRRPCSVTEPTGWCGPDLACVNGQCQLLDQCACSASNPSGCCGDGAVCQSGACVDRQCTAGVAGTCSVDSVCDTGGCTRLPCGPGHTNGSCDTGYCSASGACIPSGKCAARGDCTLNQYCASDAICHTEGTCLVAADCVTQFGNGYSCSSGVCSSTTACHSDADCAAGSEYCSAKGSCVSNGCCGADSDCSSGQSCVDRGVCDTCIVRGTCEQASDCPPASTCDTASGNCVASGTSCNSNDITTSCAPGELSCCAPGGTCCPSGQLCSGSGQCIPLGRCVDSSDCLSGFTCSNFACVPTIASGCPCASGQHCAGIPLPNGTLTSGCVPNDKCGWALDCPSGYRCNAEYECELDPQCGDLQLTTGSFVPPNVLIVFDRSASMNLCGAGDPSIGHCGYNFGTCTGSGDTTSCAPYTTKATDGTMECASFGSFICTDDSCNYNCLDKATCAPPNSSPPSGSISTTTRWSEAINAIETLLTAYVNEVSFGLAMFPHPPSSATCSIACNWFSCTDKFNTSAGVVDVAVAFGTHDAIISDLNATVPGGSTPTAATLRDILALADHGGLNALDRADAIVLVTDGDPTGDLTTVKTCEPPCSNGVKDGDETGVDCGGQCGPCPLLTACVVPDDCQSFICRDDKCRATTCTNATKDGDETDVDCGGSCQTCPDGKACSANTDCQSHICGSSGTCVAPLCNDSVMNGSETGIDCGGGCAATCADNTSCLINSDCSSGFCDTTVKQCKPAHCNNGSTDSGETGTDCGGTCHACVTQCTNGIKDGAETDIDCGGGTCPDCGGAKSCNAATDCLSGTCTVCNGSSGLAADQVCLVDAAIDRLYAANPRVKTFVVGFENSGSAALNCNAVHGKTANRAGTGWDALTPATCAAGGAPTCYYDASDATALQSALNDVIQQVSSCRFALANTPPDRYRVSVYLEDASNTANRTLATPNIQYNYDPNFNQVEFLGSTCNDVKSGARLPIVIFGCPEGGS